MKEHKENLDRHEERVKGRGRRMEIASPRAQDAVLVTREDLEDVMADRGGTREERREAAVDFLGRFLPEDQVGRVLGDLHSYESYRRD